MLGTLNRVAENPETFVGCLSAAYGAPLGIQLSQKKALTCGKTGQGIVEVAGIEPWNLVSQR